jgi:predicted DNA-binding transcriptional regulator YafY
MALLKYVERMVLINELIHKKETGNTIDFAQRIGISKRQLLNEMNELKNLGIELKYDRIKKTYFFTREQGIEVLFGKEKIVD